MGLDKFEVQSMFVASASHTLQDVGLGDASERLLMKLMATLPKAHHSTADHIRQRLMIDPTWWWHDSSILPFLGKYSTGCLGGSADGSEV